MPSKRRLLLPVLALAALGVVVGPMIFSRPRLARDERIVFFDTAARLSADGARWVLPIHGWVHEPVESTVRKGAIAKALEAGVGLEVTDDVRANFDRRVELFLVDNERGKRIVVRAGERETTLPESEPNGHFEGELEIPVAEAERIARGGSIEIRAVLAEGDARVFTGRVHLWGARGVVVVSDIDDTVKVTEVTERKKMIERTFFRDFEPAPGMAALYSGWAERGTAIHFVSSSPWHLYEPLREFLDASDFPRAPLSLKLVRLKDSTFWDLFKKGTETKPAQIEPLLAAWPERRFVLVGDSGEEDPEVYAALYRKHPGRIARIYIRNVTGAAPRDERFAAVFAGIPADVWRLFTDPAGLELPE